MNRYVKVVGNSNWFLLLTKNDIEPEGLSEDMQEKLIRTHVYGLHNNPKGARMDEWQRMMMVATRTIDYPRLVEKYGTILIRPIGSFMPLRGNEITDETFSLHFPINEFGEIVVCENDRIAEGKWIDHLKHNYPNKSIKTINFFDLRSDSEVKEYFDQAEIITFSTTFSNMEWFKKLARNVTDSHKVIGYSHDESKWVEALEIYKSIEIVSVLTNKFLLA
jgi:hypothetical protein